MLRIFCRGLGQFIEKILIERKKMVLEMKTACERCGVLLVARDEAYICSYECTFCVDCARQMNAVCPNCSGELVRRPRREDQQL